MTLKFLWVLRYSNNHVNVKLLIDGDTKSRLTDAVIRPVYFGTSILNQIKICLNVFIFFFLLLFKRIYYDLKSIIYLYMIKYMNIWYVYNIVMVHFFLIFIKTAYRRSKYDFFINNFKKSNCVVWVTIDMWYEWYNIYIYHIIITLK